MGRYDLHSASHPSSNAVKKIKNKKSDNNMRHNEENIPTSCRKWKIWLIATGTKLFVSFSSQFETDRVQLWLNNQPVRPLNNLAEWVKSWPFVERGRCLWSLLFYVRFPVYEQEITKLFLFTYTHPHSQTGTSPCRHFLSNLAPREINYQLLSMLKVLLLNSMLKECEHLTCRADPSPNTAEWTLPVIWPW